MSTVFKYLEIKVLFYNMAIPIFLDFISILFHLFVNQRYFSGLISSLGTLLNLATNSLAF